MGRRRLSAFRIRVRGRGYHEISVPPEVAEVLVPLGHAYVCELTPDGPGFVYRPAPAPRDRPDWAGP
jgi:hypothetical protein